RQAGRGRRGGGISSCSLTWCVRAEMPREDECVVPPAWHRRTGPRAIVRRETPDSARVSEKKPEVGDVRAAGFSLGNRRCAVVSDTSALSNGPACEQRAIRASAGRKGWPRSSRVPVHGTLKR